jgi:hypothetical protein
MSDRARLRLTIRPRAFRIVGLFWLCVAAGSAFASDFDGRWYFFVVGLGIGTFLVVVTRPIRVLLDRPAGVVQVHTPRFPLGTDVVSWPLAAVQRLEMEVVPDAFAGRGGKLNGYRLIWCFRSGERMAMKYLTMNDGTYVRYRDQVNDFLASAGA